MNLDTGEVDAEKTAAFQKFADSTIAAKEQALAVQVCMPAPIGCGKPITGFSDETSEREYKITGMCQTCQDAFYGSLPED